jgi:membrane associated rhomboid family serine protease
MARETAPFTALLTLALIAAFCVEISLGGNSFCNTWGLTPADFSHTGNLAPLFTHGLLHDPDAPLAHLGGNVLVLLLAGPIVERELGSVRFGVLYTMSGLVGGVLHIAVDPSSNAILVGASGSIAGILAVLGVLRPRLLGFVAGFAAWNVWLAWSGTAGNVSFATHIGGFVAGALYCVTAHFSQKERSFTF